MALSFGLAIYGAALRRVDSRVPEGVEVDYLSSILVGIGLLSCFGIRLR